MIKDRLFCVNIFYWTSSALEETLDVDFALLAAAVCFLLLILRPQKLPIFVVQFFHELSTTLHSLLDRIQLKFRIEG